MKSLKLLILLSFIGLQCVAFGQSYTNYRPLNFECGGWVSEVVPFQDKNHNITDPNSSILYARTDVGGAYYSSNNGTSWNYISTYYDNKPQGPEFSPSFLNIQGIAVHPENPNIVFVAWGLDEYDASIAVNGGANYQCLWKSTDHGNSWTKPYIDPTYQVWFKGNDNSDTHFEKLGGECIIFSPYKSGNLYNMYMGGVPKTGQNSKLFQSTNEGENWTPNSTFPGEVDEIITTIAMLDGTQQIWVGTSRNVYVSTNLGQTWQKVLNTYSNMNIKRIILGTYNNDVAAFLTFGNGGAVGIGKIKKNLNGLYDFYGGDLTYQFDLGIDASQKGTHFSTLLFPYKTEGSGIDYNHIIAGRYGRPIRESFGDGSNEPGNNWGGFRTILSGSDGQIVFNYGADNIFPNHQFTGEEFVYTGLNNVSQNPNFPNLFYSSGGAGAFKSENVTISNTEYTSFSSSTWKYTTANMSMPVVNDITFNTTNNLTFFPNADWILGLTNNFGNDFSALNYDRRDISSQFGNEYTSFATRTINCIFQGYENRDYILGCYQYTSTNNDRKATFYCRDQNGTTITYTPKTTDPLVNKANRFFADGIQFPYTENNVTVNRICALVGQQDAKTSPDPNDVEKLGIYLSDNDGTSWFPGSFTGASSVAGITTDQAYSSARLPGLSGAVGSVFDPEFNLAYDGIYIYLYLENAGVFRSTNGGTWNLVAVPPIPNNDYKDEGCIKADRTNGKLYLSTKGNPSLPRKGGVFCSSNHGDSWFTLNGQGSDIWEEATCIEANGQSIAAFGRRTQNGNTDLNKVLYKSSDGGQNWSRITDLPLQNSMTLTPRVRSLRIRPDRPNELWIATSGEGVIVYNNFQKVCLANITDHYIIQNQNYVHDCDNDIVVKDGGWLEITNSSSTLQSFKMAAGKSIIVEPGGKLTCEKTIFECTNSGTNWGGITENNSYTFNVNNCEFKDAPTSISLSNNSGYKVVTNTIFGIPAVSGESFGIKAVNINNCNFSSNSFVSTNSNTAIGISINLNPPNNDFSGEGDMPTNSYVINSNVFSGGVQQLVINCLADNVPPFWIMYNQFNPTNQSNGNGVWARKVHGYFKNNIFSSNGFGNAITFTECYFQMFQNTIMSSQTNLMLLATSTVNMQPAIDEQGQYFWNAGKNKFYLENTGEANESNINFDDGSIIEGDKGENCFFLPSSVKNNVHITGIISSGNVLSMTNNFWQPYPPIFNISGGLEYIPVMNTCENKGQISTNCDFINVGFEINDTLCVQQMPAGGGGKSSSLTNPKYIYTECLKKKRAKHFSEAIDYAKQIINLHDTSKYFLPALDELFSEYQLSDTVRNQQARSALFNSLALYLSSKINQYQTNHMFVDKAYRYYLMCLTKMKNYQEAITGYENIIINHSNPVIRLTASWDRASVILLMNSNSGGSQKEFHNDDFGVRFEELVKEKPIHEIANNTYSSMKQDYSQKLSLGLVKSADIEKKDKIEKRVSVFTANSKKELDVKINADIKALLGLKTTSTSNNALIPLTFNLSQNYPNPFNPSTKISYSLPSDAKVKLVIYDVLGREIKTLVNELKQSGKYTVEFNGSNLSSGVYFYRIQAGNFVSVKRMVLIK